MNKIYLIWELVPDETKIYYLTNLSDEEFERIKKCHGYFVNLPDTPSKVLNALNWLNEYLTSMEHSVMFSTGAVYGSASPIEIKDATLVMCGWIL